MKRIIGYACVVCGLTTDRLGTIHRENTYPFDGEPMRCVYSGQPMDESNTYAIEGGSEDETDQR